MPHANRTVSEMAPKGGDSDAGTGARWHGQAGRNNRRRRGRAVVALQGPCDDRALPPVRASASAASPSPGFLLAVAGVLSLGPVMIGAYVPALPAIRAEFGSSVTAVQLTVSLSMLVSVLGATAAGSWSDRIGRRPVVLASVAVFLAGMAACVWAPTVGVLVLGRVLAGASTTCALVVGRAAVADAFDRDTAPMAMATVHVAPLAAFALAPVVGGELTDRFGWRSTFWALAALGVVVAALAWARLPETRGGVARSPEAADRRRRLGTGWADPNLPSCVGFVLCCGLADILFVLGFVFALQAGNMKKTGDIEGARAKAKTAMLMTIIGFGLGFVFDALYGVWQFIALH